MRVDQYLQFSELGINLPNNQYSNRQAHGPEGIASKATKRQIPQTCILCTITSILLRLVLVLQINTTTHTYYLPSITCNFNASSAVVKLHKNNLAINTLKKLFLSLIQNQSVNQQRLCAISKHIRSNCVVDGYQIFVEMYLLCRQLIPMELP